MTEGCKEEIVIILVEVNSLEQSEDAVLMKRVADGDRRAFLHLYDRYANKVCGLALYILGDSMTAEEVTQDAFVRLWTRAETFNPDRGRLSSWLLTITRRLAIDRIRLDARRPRIVENPNLESALTHLPDPVSQTEEARWASLRFALDDLPDEQRSVIKLAYYQGMSQTQIADYLELPLGTVKTRIRLGMEKLRRAWQTDPIRDPQRTYKREALTDEPRD
ncbi:MAG: sigma-70 family RNA polymerase sigma factor [Anaerolineales bacterium]